MLDSMVTDGEGIGYQHIEFANDPCYTMCALILLHLDAKYLAVKRRKIYKL